MCSGVILYYWVVGGDIGVALLRLSKRDSMLCVSVFWFTFAVDGNSVVWLCTEPIKVQTRAFWEISHLTSPPPLPKLVRMT